MDDAPSVSTSIRSMADSGMALTFTNESEPLENESTATRRPLINTRVELDPRPRKLTPDEPAGAPSAPATPPVSEKVPALEACGKSRRNSLTDP